eukprot:m.183972 g.183972  ORF g.183972 m.183972 type:complete len:207 (-) comp15998_c0_seq1:353-973(-)
MMDTLPDEMLVCVLLRPELEGYAGLLRHVCRKWQRTLDRHADGAQRKTARALMTSSASLLQWAMASPRDTATPFLREDGLASVCVAAARRGHLVALQWVRTHTNHGKLSQRVYTVAALHGHLGILQWGQGQGDSMDGYDVCAHAALGGHVHVIMWARANGYRWDARTSRNAAEAGHLKLLKTLLCLGCPWEGRTGRRPARPRATPS